MKKLTAAVFAAVLSIAFAGAYAATDDKAAKSKGDAMKSDMSKDKMDMKDKAKKKEEKK